MSDLIENTKKHVAFSKNTLNVIRTTGRNNIDLINIADNKASILMSLNAIILTVLAPMVLTEVELILQERLYIPLIILVITTFTTMALCASVLRPAKLRSNESQLEKRHNISPFFFGNYYRLKPEEYLPFVQRSLGKDELVSEYVLQDLYFVGRILGIKYVYIRRAFEIFVSGIGLSLLATAYVILS